VAIFYPCSQVNRAVETLDSGRGLWSSNANVLVGALLSQKRSDGAWERLQWAFRRDIYDKLGRYERRMTRVTINVEEARGDAPFERRDFEASKGQTTYETWPSYLLTQSVVIAGLTQERRCHRVKNWDRILAIAIGSRDEYPER